MVYLSKNNEKTDQTLDGLLQYNSCGSEEQISFPCPHISHWKDEYGILSSQKNKAKVLKESSCNRKKYVIFNIKCSMTWVITNHILN